MSIRPELIAPCGLYCGVCRIHHATQEDDRTLLARLARIYARRLPQLASASPDELLCDGCQSPRRFIFCQECSIRECTQQRGFEGCHECPDFPCPFIHEFPTPVGKRVISRAIPYWRIHGTEQWVRAEEKRYTCPVCGQKLFRGARECRHCGSAVDVD